MWIYINKIDDICIKREARIRSSVSGTTHFTNTTWIAQKTPSQNHPQNIRFRSVRGPDRCYIGKQPLYFQKVILSKITRAREEYPTPQSGSTTIKMAWIGQKRPKTIAKTAHSSLSGGPSGVTSVTNHSNYIIKGAWDGRSVIGRRRQGVNTITLSCRVCEDPMYCCSFIPTLIFWWRPFTYRAHDLPMKVGTMKYSTWNIVQVYTPYWLWISLDR